MEHPFLQLSHKEPQVVADDHFACVKHYHIWVKVMFVINMQDCAKLKKKRKVSWITKVSVTNFSKNLATNQDSLGGCLK